MTTARGIRNKNPGNIVVSGWTVRQNGYTGPEPQGRFATFATMAHGVEALIRLLLVYRDQHKLTTVRQIINRWAPPVENDTGSYVMSVAKVLGVGIDDELPADPQVYAKLARAIVGHENGREAAAAVTDEDYDQAMVAAFMLPQGPASSTSDAQVSAPPAPAPSRKEKIVAIPALVTAAASALLPIIADLFRARGSKTSSRNAEIVDAVGEAAPAIVAIAKQVAGGGNEQQAVEAILADKQLQQQFRAAVALQWSDIEPFMRFEEESRDKARAFAERMTATDGPAWRQIGFGVLIAIMSLTIVVGGGAMFWNLMSSQQLEPGQKGLILGALIASFTTVVGYFFGSSATSRQKDATIADQARR